MMPWLPKTTTTVSPRRWSTGRKCCARSVKIQRPVSASLKAWNIQLRSLKIYKGTAREGRCISTRVRLSVRGSRCGRIGHVAIDPVLPVKAFFDIGGASSDAMAIWLVQFAGQEIRVLDYIEGAGQPLGYYAHELRRRGWKDAIIYLPHDGVATNNITGKRYIDHWTEAGFECETPSRIP